MPSLIAAGVAGWFLALQSPPGARACHAAGMDLGQIGIWNATVSDGPGVVAEIEALGYGALWLGGSPSLDRRAAVPRGGRARCPSSPASSTSGSTTRPTSRASTPSSARVRRPLPARDRHRPSGGDQRLHAPAEDDARVLRRARRGGVPRERARRRRARPEDARPRRRALARHASVLHDARAHGVRPRAGRPRRARRTRAGGGASRPTPRPRVASPASTRRPTCGCATTPATCCGSASPRTTSPTAAATG